MKRNTQSSFDHLLHLSRRLCLDVGRHGCASTPPTITSPIRRRCCCKRRLDLGRPPPTSNDWAEVEYLHLKDGRTVAGSYLRSQAVAFQDAQRQGRAAFETHDIAESLEEILRLVPALPRRLVHALCRHLGRQRQRRSPHGDSGGAGPDAAVSRPAPTDRARRFHAAAKSTICGLPACSASAPSISTRR